MKQFTFEFNQKFCRLHLVRNTRKVATAALWKIAGHVVPKTSQTNFAKNM